MVEAEEHISYPDNLMEVACLRIHESHFPEAIDFQGTIAPAFVQDCHETYGILPFSADQTWKGSGIDASQST